MASTDHILDNSALGDIVDEFRTIRGDIQTIRDDIKGGIQAIRDDINRLGEKMDNFRTVMEQNSAKELSAHEEFMAEIRSVNKLV
jgi:flagellar hook-associated protein FlgK